MVTALLSGEVDMAWGGPASFKQHVETGKLRAISITGKSRLPYVPNVPTTGEQGFPRVTARTWLTFVAPPGTPVDTVASLNQVFNQVLQNPAFVDRLKTLGVIPVGGPPEQLQRLLDQENKFWIPLIKALNIKGE